MYSEDRKILITPGPVGVKQLQLEPLVGCLPSASSKQVIPDLILSNHIRAHSLFEYVISDRVNKEATILLHLYGCARTIGVPLMNDSRAGPGQTQSQSYSDPLITSSHDGDAIATESSSLAPDRFRRPISRVADLVRRGLHKR